VDPAPSDPASRDRSVPRGRAALVDHWHETTPRQLRRSEDLPLYDPPLVELRSEVEGDSVRVRLTSSEANVTLRWQSQGAVTGAGREVVWQPASPEDALTVAVRGAGGLVIASVRASELPLTESG
jgi:hypothetical protein